MRPIAPALIVSLFASSLAIADTPPASDADFVKMASVGNTLEIEEAKLALEGSKDPRVTAFAQKMLNDHGDAMKKLADAAGKTGASADMMLDKPHQAMVDNLKTFNGVDFDKIYVEDQVYAHAETANLLADYVQNGKNGALKSWAQTTLPTVKEHQAMIDSM